MNVTADMAYAAGRRAYENRWPIDKCPYYAMGEEGYQLRSAWRRGWTDANQENGREVAKR
jgi:hypothetical protein